MNIYYVTLAVPSPYNAVYAFTSKRKARSFAQTLRRLLSTPCDETTEHYEDVDDYVRRRAVHGGRLLPDEDVPTRLWRILNRRYGSSSTIDRGEYAYWRLTP